MLLFFCCFRVLHKFVRNPASVQVVDGSFSHVICGGPVDFARGQECLSTGSGTVISANFGTR